MTAFLTFLLQTVVVVCVARAAGSLFRRMGQPRVVGEMVAGLMLGPSLLGRVAPRAAAFLFARTSLKARSAKAGRRTRPAPPPVPNESRMPSSEVCTCAHHS
jgi:hypothetical protein